MKTCGIVLTALLVAGPALAGFTANQSPFTVLTGTGNVVSNVENFANWSDKNPFSNGGENGNAPYRRRVELGDDPANPQLPTYSCLSYIETWSKAQTLGTILLVSPLGNQDRSSVGTLYVATVQNPGDDDWVKLNDFDQTSSWELYNVGMTGVYGVKVEVTGGDYARSLDHKDYAYQIGSIWFFEEQLEDVAKGKPTISSNGSGNMTSWSLANNESRFYANAPDQHIGVEFTKTPGEGVQLQGLLIDTCGYDAYRFDDFAVQVYRNGGWHTLGTAVQPAGEDLIWIDFGPKGEYAEQVRLFGNTASAYGKIVNGIMAFEVVVPEPMTLTLLATGGLAMLRRRIR